MLGIIRHPCLESTGSNVPNRSTTVDESPVGATDLSYVSVYLNPAAVRQNEAEFMFRMLLKMPFQF